MKMKILMMTVLALVVVTAACVTVPGDRYNTQKGALLGAGAGALVGGLAGHDLSSALLGAGIGTLVGIVAGNALDQHYQAKRDAARLNHRVVYYDSSGRAVEAIPDPRSPARGNCRRVVTRQWDRDRLISEKIEEVCSGQAGKVGEVGAAP